VELCRGNVVLCGAMQSYVGQCRVMKGNVELCREMWNCVGKCRVV
jgi:hypothetical protein